MYSVGDIKNNLRILQSEARQMKYHEEFDLDGLTKGNPQSLLPLYHHLFTTYNSQFTAEVMNILDDTLSMKSDVRFMESVYKVLRDAFNFKPAMTKEQFFTMNSFAERKVIMCMEVMRLVYDRCRFMGPKNPTNPNIKVSPVVDTGRSTKKSSMETVVTSEPSSETAMNRKVSDKCRRPASALMGMAQKDVWQLKLGYLRPKSPTGGNVGEDMPVKGTKEVENSEKKRNVANATQALSYPPVNSRKGSGVEVVNMPDTKPESSQMGVVDALPRSQDKSQSDWDPTGAVESILAKVRDLPTQLTTFMKAVESRLLRIEERLDSVEAMAARNAHMEGQNSAQDDFKCEVNTIQARLLLLENRLTLAENKSPSPTSLTQVKTDLCHEDKKEFSPNPFVSLERGEDSFTQSLVQSFSPIRQDAAGFSPGINSTITSIADADNRRFSTPNQSSSARPPPTAGSRTESAQAPVADDCITTPCLNLDASTQQQVERIRDLFKATQLLLPSNAGDATVNT